MILIEDKVGNNNNNMLNTSIFDKFEAEIQDRIGIFLGYKSKILKLNNSPLLDVKEKTPYLMQRQVELENRLTITKAEVDKIKITGNYIEQASAYTKFITLLKDINSHVDEINTLLVKSNMADEITPNSSFIGTKDWLIVALIGLVIFLFTFK